MACRVVVAQKENRCRAGAAPGLLHLLAKSGFRLDRRRELESDMLSFDAT
jgi:hypothetical protein